MPKKTTDLKVSPKECAHYWKLAKELVDAAGTYASRVKLKNNLLDSSTSWKVQNVLSEYYDGRMSSLDDAVGQARADFLIKVKKLNLECTTYKLRQITKPDALLALLLNESKRASFKGKIKTRLKNGVICPLQDFEK